MVFTDHTISECRNFDVTRNRVTILNVEKTLLNHELWKTDKKVHFFFLLAKIREKVDVTSEFLDKVNMAHEAHHTIHIFECLSTANIYY